MNKESKQSSWEQKFMMIKANFIQKALLCSGIGGHKSLIRYLAKLTFSLAV